MGKGDNPYLHSLDSCRIPLCICHTSVPQMWGYNHTDQFLVHMTAQQIHTGHICMLLK